MSNDIPAALPPSDAMLAASPAKKLASSPAPHISTGGDSKPAVQYDPEQKRRELQAAVEHLNEEVQKQKQNLSFRLDRSANRFVITVRNTQSGEVVRQIPEDVMLKVARNLDELKGVLHNESI